MLRIWGRQNSINVQKVMWVVHELGLPHSRVDAGLQFGQVNEPWYRVMNPNGRVPTIDDDGFVLWESNAIVRYLVSRYGTGNLCAPDPQSHARADSWMDWATTVLQPSMTTLFWGLIRTPPEKRDHEALGIARKQTALAMAILDRQLAERPYIAGDQLTMGDVPTGCFVHRWKALPIERAAYAKIDSWYDRLTVRLAYQAHVMLPLS